MPRGAPGRNCHLATVQTCAQRSRASTDEGQPDQTSPLNIFFAQFVHTPPPLPHTSPQTNGARCSGTLEFDTTDT